MIPRVRWFGEPWGAPVCSDPADRLPVPVGEACTFCERLILPSDRGVIMPHVDADSRVSIRPVHLACMLRNVGAQRWSES